MKLCEIPSYSFVFLGFLAAQSPKSQSINKNCEALCTIYSVFQSCSKKIICFPCFQLSSAGGLRPGGEELQGNAMKPRQNYTPPVFALSSNPCEQQLRQDWFEQEPSNKQNRCAKREISECLFYCGILLVNLLSHQE